MHGTMIENRLSRLLGERRMSISELERRTGVPYTSLHALYHGTSKRVDLATLDKLCRALGVGVGDILEYRDVSEGSTDA
ncbi:MAG: helix-turn-helix transcriptional regulator [Chloroflexota bacterium]|nr:helix-turn-helix transcriptional regulator [Chloroflexota bacterium]